MFEVVSYVRRCSRGGKGRGSRACSRVCSEVCSWVTPQRLLLSNLLIDPLESIHPSLPHPPKTLHLVILNKSISRTLVDSRQ